MLHSTGRQKTYNDNIVLNGPRKGEIGTDLTPIKQWEAQKHHAGKNLMKNMSDVSMIGNSLNQTTAAGSDAAARQQRAVLTLNARSGDIQSNHLNSMRLKNTLRSNKGNLAFASHRRSPEKDN